MPFESKNINNAKGKHHAKTRKNSIHRLIADLLAFETVGPDTLQAIR